MTIDDAIFSLETFGRQTGNGFIAINNDRAYELLLKNAVIVLEDARMIERDSKNKTVKIVNRDAEKVDFTL